MAQKMTGALVFDERTDRYDIRFDLSNCRAYVLNNKLKSIILATEYKTVFCRC